MADITDNKKRSKEEGKDTIDAIERLLAEGLDLMQNHQMNEAKIRFEKIIQLDSQFTPAYDLEMASRGLQNNPQEVPSLDLWAHTLSKLGRIEEALKIYQEITRIQPESKHWWMNLAHFYVGVMKNHMKERFTDELIISPLEIALELDPGDVQIMSNLAILYGENQDYVKSLIYLERMAEIKPLTPVNQRLMEETKKQIAKGLSRPFVDSIKKEA